MICFVHFCISKKKFKAKWLKRQKVFSFINYDILDDDDDDNDDDDNNKDKNQTGHWAYFTDAFLVSSVTPETLADGVI